MFKKKILILGLLIVVGILLAAGCTNNNSTKTKNNDAKSTKKTFVGSAACVKCHNKSYDGWQKTAHPLMIQTADKMWPESKAALEKELKTPGSSFTKIGDTSKSIKSMDEIEYVIGQKWKQRYAVKTEKGYMFLQSQYFRQGKDGSKLYEYESDEVYEDRCLDCHSTGFDLELSKKIDRKAKDYSLTSVVKELGVGCESCHGPGSVHAKTKEEEDIINPSKYGVAEQNDFCGSCHARNLGHKKYEGREDAVGFKIGDNLSDLVKVMSVVKAENVWKKTVGGVVDGYYNKASDGKMNFYADGASSAHRQQYNDFEQSEKFKKLTCTSCHDSHDPSSLKGGSFEALMASKKCQECHKKDNFKLDDVMPKRAKSQNTPDIRTHTFREGKGKPADNIPKTTDSN